MSACKRKRFITYMKAEALLNRGFTVYQIAKLLNDNVKQITRALARGSCLKRKTKVLDQAPADGVKPRQRKS